MLAIGTMPVVTFDRDHLKEGPVYLMAYYYVLHLTYPKCASTVLSVLQTEILHDAMHDGDATHSYKKALAQWKAFMNE